MAITVETLLNPAKYAQLTSKLGDDKLPRIEVDAVVASQRKNAKAWAMRAALRSRAHRPWPNDRPRAKTMDQTAKSFDALAKAGSPSEVASKQAELAKEAFEEGLGNICELAAMVTKAQQGAIYILSGRISHSLEEVDQMTLRMKEPTAEAAAALFQLAKVLKPLFQLMQLYVLKGDRRHREETAKVDSFSVRRENGEVDAFAVPRRRNRGGPARRATSHS